MNNTNNLYLNTNIKESCRDCTKRTSTCHAKCEDYRNFREALDAYNAKCKKIIMYNSSYRR